MKLIDLLAQELPKRGGWPDGALCATQSVVDGEIYFYNRPYDGQGCMPQMKGKILLPISDDALLGCEGLHPVITREQYEAALASAQQPVWNGDGLPPVGCECELMKSSVDTPKRVKIIAHFQNNAAMVAVYIPVENKYKTVNQAIACCFRPIRSEADKKRDAIIESLAYHTNAADAADLYKAIEAGEVEGVKLDV